MDRAFRTAYNQSYTPETFLEYRRRLEERSGPVEFPLAETPLFLSPELSDALAREARAIVQQLQSPDNLAQQQKAIPERVFAPGMDTLPNTLQVDFALVEGANGNIEGRLVELQAFPSLYAIETLMAEAWRETLSTRPGLAGDWTCFLGGLGDAEAHELMRSTIVGDAAPEETVLVDIHPESQKTWPDFVATKRLFGVDTVCLTKLKKDGRTLLREKGGKWIPVRRFYNRVVFDELERKNVALPFSWRDELDLTWCSHPNWYWVWSKYSLPLLKHPWVPEARYVKDVDFESEDLSDLVLKPLFSFSGGGVVLDVTKEALRAIPESERGNYLLQRRFHYADAFRTPEGAPVKAEVRVMLLRPPGAADLVPLICLIRLSRGRMLGVDFNKGLNWVGGTVGLWRR